MFFCKTDSYKCKIRQSEGRWSVSEKYLPFLCPVAHFTVHLHRWHFVPVASASCYLFMHMAIKHVKIGCPRPYNSGLRYSLYPWVYFHAQVHCDISLPDHITVWCTLQQNRKCWETFLRYSHQKLSTIQVTCPLWWNECGCISILHTASLLLLW